MTFSFIHDSRYLNAYGSVLINTDHQSKLFNYKSYFYGIPNTLVNFTSFGYTLKNVPQGSFWVWFLYLSQLVRFV